MDVWECALGFMDAQILFTATDLRIFDQLDEQALTAAQIGERTGLSELAAQRLLTALCALQLVQRRDDGSYTNSPAAAAQLVSHRRGYIGSLFRHLRHELYPVWQHLDTALREEGPQWARAFPGRETPTASMYSDPAALASFMDGMHTITYDAGQQFAGLVPELHDVRTIVDLGGASGAFLIALAEQHPALHGIVYDLPPVRPIAERHIAQHGLAERIHFHAGDFWKDPIPAGCDAYALGFILHDWHDDGCDHLLRRIADAADHGSLLIVGEQVLNDTRTGPLHVARQDLNMLVAARGRERSIAEYRDWLARHGFRTERVQSTQHGKTFLVTRRQRRRTPRAAHATATFSATFSAAAGAALPARS